MGDSFPTTEDWDNEEWSGSLSDTKREVFTPSANAQNCAENDPANQNNITTEDWTEPSEPNGPADHIPTYTYHNNHHTLIDPPAAGGAPAAAPEPTPAPPPDAYHAAHHHQPMGMSGSLSAAQSQYLSQLTQQSQRHDNTVFTPAFTVYGSSDIASQRKPQRARVPPPSKIPSSAVEMPGGTDCSGAVFLDVQFGALEPDALHDNKQVQQVQQLPAAVGGGPVAVCAGGPPGVPLGGPAGPPLPAPEPLAPEPGPEPSAPPAAYPGPTNMGLPESLSSVEPAPNSQPPATDPPLTTNTTSSLEKQLSSSMKQLGVGEPAPALPHRTKTHPTTVAQQNVYAHHAVSHHPPYANVYAPQQVNSTNASLTAASMTASQYPSSVTLTQYQPMINSYQVGAQVTSSSAAAYGGSALYSAPYSAAPYQPSPPQHNKLQQKDAAQYDSSVASSNSLTSASTTQTSTAKVVTTTAGHVSSAGGAGGAGGAGYAAAGALYGAQPGAYGYDEAQMMRGAMHHMGAYYEVGYGAREGAFGLSAGERFGRTDAASPQQVPAAALPPGYAYFAYQPPPNTYQYGVYPTYGGGSSVGGVGSGAGGKVSSYAQQPPYDQDSYKPGGPYTGNANKSGGAATADLTNNMYAKTHVALNKVNSYDKAAFHSGTPPPFGATSHLYIPAPPHHHPHHLPPQHQESGAGGRSAAPKAAGGKPNYSQSYWAPN